MLRRGVGVRRVRAVRGARFAVVASRYNGRFVNGLLGGVRRTLLECGVVEGVGLRVVRVPGAFEIPVVAARLVSGGERWDGVIGLGVVLRGATGHADQVGGAVAYALAGLQVVWQVPMVHGVLLLSDVGEARERCLCVEGNRGVEFACAALEMARVMRSL